MKLLYFISSFYVIGHAFARVELQRQRSQNQSSNISIESYEAPTTVRPDQNMSLVRNSNETGTESILNRAVERTPFEEREIYDFPRGRINLTYPTPVLYEQNLDHKLIYYKRYTNYTFHPGILGIGINNFVSYAAHFCKNETQGGRIEIISIGCGDGSVDRKIIDAYRDLFGEELKITLIDPDSKYEVDFRTVDDLIQKRASVVGNCSLLIFWPESYGKNDNYDIESIYKLRPQAVLTLLETTGMSGSDDFLVFFKIYLDYKHVPPEMISVLKLYNAEEVVYQEVHLEANKEMEIIPNVTYETKVNSKAFRLMMMKARRTKSIHI